MSGAMEFDDPRVQIAAEALMATAFPHGHPYLYGAEHLKGEYDAWVKSFAAYADAVVDALDRFEGRFDEDEELAAPVRQPLDDVLLENTGTWLTCHHSSKCAGQVCSLHNRSNHHLRDWPQRWRAGDYRMERVCEHGIGHPDPDDFMLRTGVDDGSHGCDGCCLPKPLPNASASDAS